MSTPDAIDVEHLTRQREWSRRTFGPSDREHGVSEHIRLELDEIHEAITAADKLAEWVDVIILAFDGAWRCGAEPAEIIAAIKAKQARNEARSWPDWRTAGDGAIEHVAEPPKACDGFRWIGQPLTSCDRCGQPYWEHTHDHQMRKDAGPFDPDPWVLVPITPEQADVTRRRWSPA